MTVRRPDAMRRTVATALSAIPLLVRAQPKPAEHVVQMLNQGKDGAMVFEPAFVRAAVGDTVVFRPTQVGGHNSASVLVPDGAKASSGPYDKELRVTLEREGVYIYVCTPHRAMGMAGVVQVGKPVNLAAAKAFATREQAGWATAKDRLDKALAQVR